MNGPFNDENQLDLEHASAQELRCELAAIDLWENLVELNEVTLNPQQSATRKFAGIAGSRAALDGETNKEVFEAAVRSQMRSDLLSPNVIRCMVWESFYGTDDKTLRACISRSPFYQGLKDYTPAQLELLNQVREIMRTEPEAALTEYSKHYDAAIRSLGNHNGPEPLLPS